MILNFKPRLTNKVNLESEECTFCFVCLKGLRGRECHSGDEGDEVKGQFGRGRKNPELNSIKILMTYLLNTGDRDNKHDSVLKGILKLAGVGVSSDHGDEKEVMGEGRQNTPTRKGFSLCDKCEGIAGQILELHLELEKAQMKIVQEVKTVREEIRRSSGWLGGTEADGEGMMNELEEEEAFENFARRFLDADFSMKARGTFGLLKSFQAAVADIDKTAILVPMVYLDRCAITQNHDLLSSTDTGIVKTEPHDEDDPMEGCQDDEANAFSVDPPDPGHCFGDNDDFNGDAFISSLDDDFSKPQPVPRAPSQPIRQKTELRGRGRPLGRKNRKRPKGWTNSGSFKKSSLPDQKITETSQGQPHEPEVKQESFENLMGNSELVVVGESNNIGIGSWNPAEDDSNPLHDLVTDLHEEGHDEIIGSDSFDPNPDPCSELPAQREGPIRRKRKKGKAPKGWSRSRSKKYAQRRLLVQATVTQMERHPLSLPPRPRVKPQLYQPPQPQPKPKPTKKSKKLAKKLAEKRKILKNRSAGVSPWVLLSDYEDEDLDSVPQEDPKDTEYIPGVKKGPPRKKKSHSERLVQSAKRRRGRPSGDTDKQPLKKKSPSISKNDGLPVEKRKVGRPIIGEGPNPLTRTGIGRRLACESCSFKHRHIHRFEQHLRSHETEEKVFKCQKCDEGFSNEQNYRLHEGRHRGHWRVRCEVEVCHQRCFSIFQIAKHLKSHNEVGDQLFPCSFCSHILPSVGLLLGHLRKYHGDAEWKCVVCGDIFKKVTELGDHLQEAHQAVEKISCGVDGCERSFYDPESLRLHKKIHQKTFSCPQCDKCFTTQTTFDFHQEFHRTGKPYKCDLDNCSEAFPDNASLRKHKVEVHHIERQVCEICGKECCNSSSLKGHMVTVHGVGEGKPCPVCNKLFAYSREVSKHMEQAHSTAKNYICEDCGKAFKTMEKCRNHRKIHGERTHQCPHCPLAFHQRPPLLDHIRIHTGEKPYLCRICKKAFRQGGTRNKHESICPARAGASSLTSTSTSSANEPQEEPSKTNEMIFGIDDKPSVLS